MSFDLDILEKSSTGSIELTTTGKSEDTGWMLFQRLLVLLFADGDYRDDEMAEEVPALMGFLEGANVPDDEVMNSIIVLICSQTLQRMEDSDRELVKSFTGVWEDEKAKLTLELMDGTTLTGVLNA